MVCIARRNNLANQNHLLRALKLSFRRNLCLYKWMRAMGIFVIGVISYNAESQQFIAHKLSTLTRK